MFLCWIVYCALLLMLDTMGSPMGNNKPIPNGEYRTFSARCEREATGSTQQPGDRQRGWHSATTKINSEFYTSLNRLKDTRLSHHPGDRSTHNLSVTRQPSNQSRSDEKSSIENKILWNFPSPNFTDITFGAVVRHIKENVIENVIHIAADEPSQAVIFEYPAFEMAIPRFVSSKGKELFLKNMDNHHFMTVENIVERTGIIKLIANGTANVKIDCGWTSNLTEFVVHQNDSKTEKEQNTIHTSILIPLFVPNGDSFQHFLDGVLPKLIQITPVLRMDGVKLALFDTYNEVVQDIIYALGIHDRQIIMVSPMDGVRLTSTLMINTCITPALHPILWKTAQQLIGVPAEKAVPIDKAYVILLTRAKSNNPGRKIVNSMEVVKFLRIRYGDRLVIFRGGYSLRESINLFSKARLLIGVHGGAFYNVNFCTAHTSIVEFMPTLANGTVPNGLAHTITWRMATALGQDYWRIPYTPLGQHADARIELVNLKLALDVIDQPETLKDRTN